MVKSRANCLQEDVVKKLQITSAVQQSNIDTMVKQIGEIKESVKDIDDKINHFIESADDKYATKKEVNDLKGLVNFNTNKLWLLSREVAQWGVMIAAVTKFAGFW